MTLAWHFTRNKLRGGRPIPPIGEWLEHDGPIVMCKSGLHASVDILDALSYAPGPILHRVEMDGRIIEGEDKLVATRRRILWSVDLTDTLREFARACALDVVDLWDCPEIVRRYLETGHESIREAAGDAALDAARYERDAAWNAAVVAVRAAARDATLAAAWAAWVDVGNAVRDKQRERLLEMIATKSGKE